MTRSTYFDISLREKELTVVVTHYSAERPMKVYGSGMGDAHPPEPEEFEFKLVDKQGDEVELELTDEEIGQIRHDFLITVEGMGRGYD